MIHTYIKPRLATMFDSYRNLQPMLDGEKFYSNGFYAVKMDILLKYYPTLYCKILNHEKEARNPDLEHVIKDTKDYVELVLWDMVEIKEHGEVNAFLKNADLGLKIMVDALYISFFTKIATTKFRGYRMPIKFYGRTNDKPVLVKMEDQIIGVIMPKRDEI